MKAIWNGHISFGLISIPISVHSAVEASERVSFRLLHRKDHAPIQYKKFCSKEDVEVPNDEIVRGYELEDDEYTVVEKDELDKVEDEASPERGDGGSPVRRLRLAQPAVFRQPLLRRAAQGRGKGLRGPARGAARSAPGRHRAIPAAQPAERSARCCPGSAPSRSRRSGLRGSARPKGLEIPARLEEVRRGEDGAP